MSLLGSLVLCHCFQLLSTDLLYISFYLFSYDSIPTFATCLARIPKLTARRASGYTRKGLLHRKKIYTFFLLNCYGARCFPVTELSTCCCGSSSCGDLCNGPCTYVTTLLAGLVPGIQMDLLSQQGRFFRRCSSRKVCSRWLPQILIGGRSGGVDERELLLVRESLVDWSLLSNSVWN